MKNKILTIMAIMLCCIIIFVPFVIHDAFSQKVFTTTTKQIDIKKVYQDNLVPGITGATERTIIFRDLQKVGINNKFTYKNIISELEALGYTKEQSIKAIKKVKKEEENERSK